jgi:hypothetical protein
MNINEACLKWHYYICTDCRLLTELRCEDLCPPHSMPTLAFCGIKCKGRRNRTYHKYKKNPYVGFRCIYVEINTTSTTDHILKEIKYFE